MFCNRLLPILLLFISNKEAHAQYTYTGALKVNTISTAVPFLRIAPDARSGSMGDIGVATPTDVHSIFHNPAKIAFAKNMWGAGLSYTPWLKELVNDIYLADISGYWKPDSLQAITVSGRYFSLGSITFANSKGQTINTFNPREFATNLAYARKLSRSFSLGINLGYVYSNLTSGQSINGTLIKAGTAYTGGLSAFFSHKVKSKALLDRYNIGLCISNLGPKISYTSNRENADFLPSNLGLGTSLEFKYAKKHHITLALDLNKLLVPTPDSSGNYRTISPMQGALQSFNDAPGGLTEELQEIMIGTGVEYTYNNLIFGRCGYFFESANKGNRRFITIGAGGRYKFVGLDISYLIPTSGQGNPLDNTLRFTLYFLIK